MNDTSNIKERHEHDAWLNACEQDTLTAYLRFLSQFPNSNYREHAIRRREELEEERAWRIAQRSDRIYTYEKFLDDYPNGKFAKLAGKRIIKLEKNQLKKPQEETGNSDEIQLEELALEEATNLDSIAAYNHFLKNFPHSAYGKQIRERMHQLESRLAVQYRFLEIELQNWERADKLNTALAYRDFLEKFPAGKFSNLAAQRLEALGEQVVRKAIPNKTEPEKIAINPNSSPLFEIIKQHKKEKDMEEKSAMSLAYVWLALFVINAAVVFILAPVFLHFVMALALLSAGYFMYTRSKQLSNRELSIYGYGICLAVWVSSNELFGFLGFQQILSWVFASLIALGALVILLKYVEGFNLPQKEGKQE